MVVVLVVINLVKKNERHIVKDWVNGKLMYVGGDIIDKRTVNEKTYHYHRF